MKEIKNKIVGKGHNLLFSGLFPIKSRIRTEIIAGLILAAIGIPEVMGYAKIAGMPIITGLYTILLPLALFAIFCSSRHLIVGADSATAAILVSTLAPLALIGSPNYITLVSTVAVICALILLLAHIFKLGFIANFMSRTVLVGFLTGVGIQVAISQVPGMLGLPGGSGLNTIPQLTNIFIHLSDISMPTITVSTVVIIIIRGFRHISPKIPGPLIAVIGTIIASSLFNFNDIGISVVGSVPSGLPSIGIPSLNTVDYISLFVAAFTCFIVIIAQSAATSRAYAFHYSEDLDEDKDILGLAIANGAAGLTGTFVVNGSPTKTEIADEAGSRSQIASLVTAAVVLAVLLFFTNPISFIPEATLASIVFLIGINLIDIKSLRDIRSKVKQEYFLAIFIVIIIILAGVLWGIILSIILSLLLHLSHSYKPVNSMLIRNKKSKWVFTPVSFGKSTEDGLIIYRFNRDLFYANSDLLRKEVLKLVDKADPPLKWFILDTSGFSNVDYTSLKMLKDLYDDLADRNVTFAMIIVLPDLKNKLEALGLIDGIGSQNIYESVLDARKAFEAQN